MHLGFIGMAGAGKSYWATKFADAGFTCFHCDDLIAAHLRTELGAPLLTMHDVGEWMGMPYDQGFPEREEKYLHYEREVLQTLTTMLSNQENDRRKFVIDMTGSAIYAGSGILSALRRHLTIVYFSVSSDAHEQMLQSYLAQPRPVVWNGYFKSGCAANTADALASCYPQLISSREALYESLCHIKLDYSTHRRPGFTVEELMALVKTSDRKNVP